VARILLIEDDEHVGRVLLRTLRNAGHEVLLCGTAVGALERLHLSPSDVVITDLFLPDHHGLELISILRAAYPCLSIVAITGGEARVERDLVEAAVRNGAVCGLRKPFGADALLNAVAMALRARGHEQHA
jgi:two-component system OmpR family response regulator